MNMGDKSGTIRPGDPIICDGKSTTVTEVRVHPPFTILHAPIHRWLYTIEAVTPHGSRWAGGERAQEFVGGGAMWDRY